MTRIVILLALLLSVAGIAGAEERSSLWPTVPTATGEPHPEGNEYMRKHHMDLMRHDRDLTVRQGERGIKASLKGCFECHSVKDEQGQVVTVRDERHFCRVCHDFAAVKVDCFMCHRSTPEGVDEGAAHAGLMTRPEGNEADVAGYLRGLATRPAKRGGSPTTTTMATTTREAGE